MPDYHDSLREMLFRQLRGATCARIASGADPDALAADLTERLRRLRRMREEAARDGCH